MTPGSFATISLPPLANAGMITVTIGTDVASGNATTAAALAAGTYFVMTGQQDRYQCVSTPIDIGGGVFNFQINRSPSSTMTKQAWSITQAADEDTLGLIYSQDDAGNTAGRAAHDAAADGYTYLDTQATRIWERNGPAGTWTDKATTIVVWVATTGSDTDENATQLLTVQKAVDRVAESDDLSGWTVIIALKPGTYNQTVNLKEVDGDPALLAIMGEASLTGVRSAATYTISSSVTDAIRATGIKTVWTLDGFTLVSTKGHCMQAKNARLRFNQLRFGACAGSHIACMGGGSIVLAGDGYSIANGCNAHLNVNGSGGVIDLQAESTTRPTVTLPATNISFKAAYAWARASGQIFTGTGLSFVNKTKVVNTKRWRAEQNSSIDSGQSGEKYLPGDQNGIAVKNGEYL